MPPAERKHTKGMSPKHVRKAHVARSTEYDAPIFCKTSKEKWDTMSPKSARSVIDDTATKLDILRTEAAEKEASAKRKLFGLAGSSAAHAIPSSPKKKNNKGQPVSPFAPTPDGALSPTNPGRDGSTKVKRILACSPEAKIERVD